LSAKTIDVLIFIPVIPAIPVIATWFLPWERWIPRKIPKSIIGPYLLYCSFAAWHFHEPRWVIAGVAVFGFAVSTIAADDLLKARQVKRARDWPTTKGTVIHIDQRRNEDGLLSITLTYAYTVNDERYADGKSMLFKKDRDAAKFEDECRERTVTVHYRPDKPEISVLDTELHNS
jgi:hypothetical protein